MSDYSKILHKSREVYFLGIDGGGTKTDLMLMDQKGNLIRGLKVSGWVMVRAKENNVASILEALKEGRFYSSCGPEIYNFYVDGTKVVVECSEANRVRFQSDMHPTRVVHAGLHGTITKAVYEMKKMDYKYIRATVIDKEGRYAWTNPIFLQGAAE